MSTIARAHQNDPFFNQMYQAVSSTTGMFYVRMEDEIRLSVFTTTAGLTITLNAIVLDNYGDAKAYSLVLNPTGSGSRESVQSRIGPGFLLYCYATLTGGTPAVGAVTVAVEVLQSDSSSGPIVKQVMFGSLTAQGFFPLQTLSGTVTVSGTTSVSNLPTPNVITVANPAAGAEITITVPASTTWDVRWVSYKLTCSAAVATRNLFFQVKSPSLVLGEWQADLGITASNTDIILFGGNNNNADTNPSGSNFIAVHGFPQMILTTGMTMVTRTAGIDVADQYSQIRVGAMVYAA